jgi:endonuclease/exonuclease/phosphatase family metal-dependent hydrolase
MTSPALRVATWNINGGILSNGASRTRLSANPVEEIASTLSSYGPDIVALQEVPFSPRERLSETFTARVARLARYQTVVNWPMSPSHLPSSELLGIAILSNLALRDESRFKLPNPGLHNIEDNGKLLTSHDKGLLLVDTEFSSRDAVFASCHLLPLRQFGGDPFEERFRYLWDAVSKCLDPLVSRPSIVCGDFNTGNLERLLPKVVAHGKFSALVQSPTRGTGQQHDNVLVTSH